MSEPLVVIGNGMAAAKFCEELSARALGRHAIAVIGDEPRLAYNRVLLSSLLANEIDEADVGLKPAAWWRDRGVTMIFGRAAQAIDTAAQRVHIAGGGSVPYVGLVLATGSRAIRLPLPGNELPGVMTFRELADVDAMRSAAGAGRRAVVIGGGLLGLEAAYGLAKGGADVTLVHLMDRLMERQLDARASAMLKSEIEAKGITVLTQADTAAIEGEGRVERVVLKDGRVLPADLVVMAIGVRPNAELARAAGLAVNRGVTVGDDLRTSAENVYAIGECAEHAGACYGLVEPAYEQARVLAQRFTGVDARYGGSVLATNLKVSGVNVFSCGDFMGAPGTEEIVLRDPGLKTYKKLVVADGRLVGAVLFGDTADGLWYLDLVRGGASIERMRGDLVFGRALADRLAA